MEIMPFVSIEPVSRSVVEMVSDRDMGTEYGTGERKYRRGLEFSGLAIHGQYAGFTISGLYPRDGQWVGEVAIAHISPEFRGLGLGSILTNLGQGRLTALNADVLSTEVIDKTGKMEHLLAKQGFELAGTAPYTTTPVWEKALRSPEEHGRFIRELTAERERAIRKLGVVTDLEARAIELNRDNPDLVDVEEVVEQRLRLMRFMTTETDHTNIFGFRGNKVNIYTARQLDYGNQTGMQFYPGALTFKRIQVDDIGLPQAVDRVGDFKAFLVVRGVSEQDIKQALARFNGDVFTTFTYQEAQPGTKAVLGVESKAVNNENLLAFHIQRLASVAAELS